MNATSICLLITIAVDAAIGIMVYLTNTRRTVNQFFLVLAAVMSLWASCVLRIVQAPSAGEAEFWMRIAFIVCTLIPGSFTGLLMSIQSPEAPLPAVYRRTWPFWISALAASIMCMTEFFLRSVVLPEAGTDSVPEALYGPGFHVYVAFFVLASLAALVRFIRNLLRAEAMKRVELQFVLLGSAVCIVIGTTASLFIPLLTDSTGSSQFGPLSSTALMLIIAYGIAKHRIMDVTQLLRKATAYALLVASLVLLYGAIWHGVHYLLILLHHTPTTIASVVAAVVVALAMTPAHGFMQRFASQIFINLQDVDIGDTVRRTSRILHSITILPDLLDQFSAMLKTAVGTDRVAILLLDGDAYVQRYPAAPTKFPLISLIRDDTLVRRLEATSEPVVVDVLQRRRPTPERTELAGKMTGLKAAIAIGIRSRVHLDGVMLLGPRVSGRIYGNIEQNALQILCDQFAVALENARLYTEMQNSKIYNEILLDNLVSGVVAADAHGMITVFNREAQRITRLNPKDVLNHPIDMLPDPLAILIQDTFQTGRNLRYLEIAIHNGQEEVPVRVGTSIFRGYTRSVMGVLAVFSDQTRIKKLEQQVRRTDRLASVGTLSAGMAHEIKNPLVSIKTFSQLLPERYNDPEFRENFAALFDREVKRIDSIVNQLLNFARPAKPHLTPSHLHQVLDNSLKLVQQNLQQKGIHLERSYAAPHDLIHADADLLDQAFVNFFMNAVEAMQSSGSLRITTDIVQEDWRSPTAWASSATDRAIRVAIRDTGVGIPSHDLASIFDPFFTTKSNGTGLGLSVAHGIIQEHGGAIDVESAPMQGTTFHVSFPLIDEEVPA